MRTLLILSLMAVAALADDEAYGRRYHEAYVLEVIDGKVSEAAKAYLALLQDKNLPDGLRVQTEFRFAVTCVLLGRADEGRARLAALAKLEGLPDRLRAQVEEYRKSIADVKVGTALETNVQALTMKLGLKYSGGMRMHAAGVYREFEILGPRTIPYVRRLLRHNDRDLRWHAFQILVRLDAPDVLELWDPAEMDPGDAFVTLARKHPERTGEVEAAVRRLRGGMLKNALQRLQSCKTLSPEFIRWAAEQPECANAAVIMLAWSRKRVETEPIVLDWIRNGRPELQRAAARSYSYWAGRKGMRTPADLFVPYCLLLEPESSPKAYGSAVPPATRLEALRAVLDRAEKDEEYASRGLLEGIADELASLVDPAVGRGIDPQEYAVEVRRWLRLVHARTDWEESDEPMGAMLSVRRVVVALPAADTEPLVREVLELFGSDRTRVVLGFERPEDLPLIRAAMKTGNPAIGEAVARSVQNPQANVEYLRAAARLWPEFAPWMGRSLSYPYFFQFLATRIPAEEAQASLLATARAVGKKPYASGLKTIARLIPASSRCSEEPVRTYLSKVLVPALPKLFRELPRNQRLQLARDAVRLVHETDIGEDRKRVAAAVLDALGSLGPSVGLHWNWVTEHPELFPLERWARSPHPRTWHVNNLQPAQAEVERAARYFAQVPSWINDSVAAMLAALLHEPQRKWIAEELGRKANAETLKLLVEHGLLPSYPLLEKRVLEISAQPKVSDLTLIALVTPVVKNAPSPRLFPVVKRLLRSERTSTVMTAMDLATSLGSEELIPSIAPALDSMNSDVREKAKRSIESILDARRIKREIAERFGGK